MAASWPALSYDEWSATCDTLHAHTQVLGKVAYAVAPHEPDFQHAALRLTARGWETAPLPAPNGSGAFTIALDLHAHAAVVEHVNGAVRRVALMPSRSVGEVTRDVLTAVRDVAGAVEINLQPSETPWTTPLDKDTSTRRTTSTTSLGTSKLPVEPRSCSPSSARPTAAARRRSMRGGAPSTSPSVSTRTTRST